MVVYESAVCSFTDSFPEPIPPARVYRTTPTGFPTFNPANICMEDACLLNTGCLLHISDERVLFVLGHVSAFRTGEEHAYCFFLLSLRRVFVSYPHFLVLYIPDSIWCIPSTPSSWPCFHFFLVAIQLVIQGSFLRCWFELSQWRKLFTMLFPILPSRRVILALSKKESG